MESVSSVFGPAHIFLGDNGSRSQLTLGVFGSALFERSACSRSHGGGGFRAPGLRRCGSTADGGTGGWRLPAWWPTGKVLRRTLHRQQQTWTWRIPWMDRMVEASSTLLQHMRSSRCTKGISLISGIAMLCFLK
ncbi:uncharacterized protein LOC127754582 [Oryza glaberrima]|uniref:uncharacterized protein LOC127754582 n=1 Tax=Oryza glaberrima TaxID=4538 RepID=UPI00224BFCC8|nr:uncharacterized protein LOC127754582 [Oryza glaberrima]